MFAVDIFTGRTFSTEDKQAAFELYNFKDLSRLLGCQLEMSEANLSNILTVAKNSLTLRMDDI
jgi:hypothetical protein